MASDDATDATNATNPLRRITALATHAAAIRAVEHMARALQAPFARQRPDVPALEQMIQQEMDFYTWFMFQAL